MLILYIERATYQLPTKLEVVKLIPRCVIHPIYGGSLWTVSIFCSLAVDFIASGERCCFLYNVFIHYIFVSFSQLELSIAFKVVSITHSNEINNFTVCGGRGCFYMLCVV